MRRLMVTLLLALLAAPAAAAAKPLPTIAQKTAGLTKIDGFVPLYRDDATGHVYMEIDRFRDDFLYQVSLTAGVGSNPIGLDRNQLGPTAVVHFVRVGPKVLLVQPNQDYRAVTGNRDMQRGVRESFAQSVLWGFTVAAQTGDHVLVDATDFFLRDAHGVARQLERTKQGHYKLDLTRSAFYEPRTKGFPKNTEVEVTLTFTTDGEPGPEISQVTPTPDAVTVREHYSLVELPPLGSYTPRDADPRVGYFGVEFNDYAAPIDGKLVHTWIARHKLVKQNPAAAMSDPVEPLVYYVDNTAPKLIRDTIMEGMSWWNQAFEAAGFHNAFQVRVLPQGADPMDLRYNMINWVDRSTRGWSYGGGVIDPRTGQILKGNVTLGSLRIRQDYLIGSGLVGVPSASAAAGGEPPFTWGFTRGYCDAGALPDESYLADFDPSTTPVQMALARLRQLAAHETGHSLGLAHNFAASTFGRASVMDYPAPLVEIHDGHLDLSHAYAVGIGSYDKFAIKYGYSQFPPGTDEHKALAQIIADGQKDGMLYLSDAEARPAGAADPRATLWDNGSDAVAELRHEIEVRKIALSEFGLKNISNGTPLAALQAKLLPIYLHHRYQLFAATKTIGGMYYTYSVKTDGVPSPAQVTQIIPAAKQRDALSAVLETLDLDALTLPDRILDLIPPVPDGDHPPTEELFTGHMAPVFDPVAAASIAADMTVSGLLQPQRAARLVEFHGRDANDPGFTEVVQALVKKTWTDAIPANGAQAVVARAVQEVVVHRLMELAANQKADAQVRAVATMALRSLRDSLLHPPAGADAITKAFWWTTGKDITRFLNRPASTYVPTATQPEPPGDPIGASPRSGGTGGQ
ncbi:MAG: zinc-dependent metalloprotease [Acidobacteriota bacterium]|nr:zinc-dependent metalloprotease [Acidobacteriota bacterium]